MRIILLTRRKTIKLFDVTRVITTNSVFEKAIKANLIQVDLEIRGIQ